MGINVEVCKKCKKTIRKDPVRQAGTVYHYKLVCDECKALRDKLVKKGYKGVDK